MHYFTSVTGTHMGWWMCLERLSEKRRGCHVLFGRLCTSAAGARSFTRPTGVSQ